MHTVRVLNQVRDTLKVSFKGMEPLADHPFIQAREIISTAIKIIEASIKNKRKNLAKKIIKLRIQAKQNALNASTRRIASSIHKDIYSFSELYRETIHQAQLDCIQICIDICTEIMQKDISQEHIALAKKISAAIGSLSSTRKLNIFINHCHYESLKTLLENSLDFVSIKESEAIKPGNALIQSNIGTIELNWLSHLQAIEAKLIFLLSQASNNTKNC
jgi:flagellar biosynthesis/type III secretory pathway protein FliH